MTTKEALRLKAMIGDYPITAALKKGEVCSDLVSCDFAEVKVAHDAFKRTVRELEFDVSELAIVTYLMANARGACSAAGRRSMRHAMAGHRLSRKCVVRARRQGAGAPHRLGRCPAAPGRALSPERAPGYSMRHHAWSRSMRKTGAHPRSDRGQAFPENAPRRHSGRRTECHSIVA